MRDRSFFALFKRATKRAIALIAPFQNKQMHNPAAAGLGNRSFAHRSFLLFSKEQMSDRSLWCSFQNSEWAIALFFALFKRATKRAIALSVFQKEWKSKNEQKMSDFPNCSFFSQKKSDRSFFKFFKWANAQPWPIGKDSIRKPALDLGFGSGFNIFYLGSTEASSPKPVHHLL